MSPTRQPLTYVVSRHPGLLAWVRAQGIAFDHHRSHLQPQEAAAGDTVIGTLPIHRVADLCARGVHYMHLALDIPREARGRELTAEDLDRYGAQLVAYRVTRVDDPRVPPPG